MSGTTLRRYVVRVLQRTVVASWAALLACGVSRIPPTLRGYDILVERGDSLGTELARAFRDEGYRVRRAVRGGGRRAAAAVVFTFQPPGPAELRWLHLRLADTRSGVIVGAASVPLDSLPTLRAQATAAVRALTTAPLQTAP